MSLTSCQCSTPLSISERLLGDVFELADVVPLSSCGNDIRPCAVVVGHFDSDSGSGQNSPSDAGSFFPCASIRSHAPKNFF